MKKKVLIGVAVVVVVLVGVVVAALNTDSPECEEMKSAICEYCGAETPACKKVQDAITTTDECVQAMDVFKGSEEMLKLGGDAAKKAFCDGVAE